LIGWNAVCQYFAPVAVVLFPVKDCLRSLQFHGTFTDAAIRLGVERYFFHPFCTEAVAVHQAGPLLMLHLVLLERLFRRTAPPHKQLFGAGNGQFRSYRYRLFLLQDTTRVSQ